MTDSVALRGLISRNMPYVAHLARKASNSVATPEDIQQDILERIIKQTVKDETFFDMPEQEQDWGIKKVIFDFHVDKIRYYARRPDTSKYRPSVMDGGIVFSGSDDQIPGIEIDYTSPTFNCSDFNDPEFNLIQDSILEELILRAEPYEDRYPGIVRFIQEAMFPSDETVKAYNEYLDKPSTKRISSRHYIPPYRLVKILGISESRLRRYHIVISKLLSNLGVSRASEIYKRVSFN